MEIQKQSPRSVHRKTLVPKSQVCNFIKKESLPQVFSCEFCKISKSNFSHRKPTVVASGNK